MKCDQLGCRLAAALIILPNQCVDFQNTLERRLSPPVWRSPSHVALVACTDSKAPPPMWGNGGPATLRQPTRAQSRDIRLLIFVFILQCYSIINPPISRSEEQASRQTTSRIPLNYPLTSIKVCQTVQNPSKDLRKLHMKRDFDF